MQALVYVGTCLVENSRHVQNSRDDLKGFMRS